MNSNARVTRLFAQLVHGEVIVADAFCQQYEISLRTFQRDLAVVKTAAEDQFELLQNAEGAWYFQDRKANDRQIANVIGQIVIGSRGLATQELDQAVAWLLQQLSTSDQHLISRQWRQVRAGYIPMTEAKLIVETVQTIESAIIHQQTLTFEYGGSTGTNRVVKTRESHGHQIKQAQPVALFFEEHYWYTAMYSLEHDRFRLYRIDRIQRIIGDAAGVKIDYAKRFSLSDHRQQTYLLGIGEPVTFTFEYSEYVATALDRFPHSKVIRQNSDHTVVIQAYAKIESAVLWLMSQGAAVKVLTPPSLIQRLKAQHLAAIQRYERD